MSAPLLAPIIAPRVMRLTIVSRDRQGGIIAPATKKNHATIIRTRGRHGLPALIPSEQFQVWEKGALDACVAAGLAQRYKLEKNGKLRVAHRWLPWPAVDYPVNCRAVICRQANIGDAVGYYQAIGDWLQAAGVVVDDKWIVSWDGSRMTKDAAAPRVEIELREVVDE